MRYLSRFYVRRGSWFRAVALVAAMGTLAALAAASASSGATTGTGSGKAATGSVASSTCAKIPTVPVKDPSGVVAQLPKKVQELYNDFPYPVTKSVWDHFKGVKPPWKIGISIGFPLVNASGIDWVNSVKLGFNKAKKQGLVTGSLMIKAAVNAATTTPAAQIAGIQSMIRAGADGIFVLPLSAVALEPVITAAGKKGIPVVPFDNPSSPSRYGIGYVIPDAMGAAQPASAALDQIGGKGNVLIVGIAAGQPYDTLATNGYKQLLNQCPDAHLVGDLYGEGSPVVSKTQVLNFLASNPEKIDAVFAMINAAPIIQAFQQAGRPVPVIASVALTAGDLAWWSQNSSYCCLFSTSYNSKEHGYAAWRIMQRILSGKGLKVNNIMIPQPSIDKNNYKRYEIPGATVSSGAETKGSAKDGYAPNSYLNYFFVKKGE